MRVEVGHTLNARFVEIAQPCVEEFQHSGVLVRVETTMLRGRSFATVACSGSIEDPSAVADATHTSAYFPFVAMDGRLHQEEARIRRAWFAIEPVLHLVGTALRWRFGLFGDDPVFASTHITVELHDGNVVELTPMPSAVMGDDTGAIGPDGLRLVAELVGASVQQPLAHELWRESWNLRHASPRSSLVVGVAAAEVGFKQLVALLVPDAKTLVEHVLSPPLDIMIRRVLPGLPIRSGLEPEKRCPQHLRKRVAEAVEVRNLVVHRGTAPQIDLRSTLLDIRDFLYLLDYHAGYGWALELLSKRTHADLVRT